MKLRNKKTGKIINSDELLTDKFILDLFSRDFDYFNSKLHKINDEWEEYEAPKTFFTIYYDGTISEFKDGDDDQIRDMKAIGNYFETKEEAEKAVEKLKAWKRLKDKGFKLDAVVDTFFCLDIFMKDEPYEAIKDDLKIVFGGEE